MPARTGQDVDAHIESGPLMRSPCGYLTGIVSLHVVEIPPSLKGTVQVEVIAPGGHQTIHLSLPEYAHGTVCFSRRDCAAWSRLTAQLLYKSSRSMLTPTFGVKRCPSRVYFRATRKPPFSGQMRKCEMLV